MLPHRHLGRLAYRDAWAVQLAEHAAVVEGRSAGAVLTVEHPPVITLGRRAEVSASHLRADAGRLRQMGVEVVESDRGGDITYHGPGQLVVYPVLRLSDFRLSVGGYVRLLQLAVVDLLAELGVRAFLDPDAVGVWVDGPRGASKVCAFGVRVRAGVTLHGLALNLTTDLSHFDWIVPCGLSRPVTSLAELLGYGAVPAFTDAARLAYAAIVRRLTACAAAPEGSLYAQHDPASPSPP